MIHVLAAHGAEPCEDGAGRTLGLGGSSSRIGPGDRLGHFNPGIVAPLGDRSEMVALADGFVDRSAGPSAQSAQHGALRAVRIVHRPAAPTAGSAGHPLFIAEFSIPPQANAIEPRLVEEFARLHVKADGTKPGSHIASGEGLPPRPPPKSREMRSSETRRGGRSRSRSRSRS
jgi:hypothetical protein